MKRSILFALIILISAFLFAEDPIDFTVRYAGGENCWEISFILTQIQTEELAIWYPTELGNHRKVKVLYNKTLFPGQHVFYWDGKDDNGNFLPYLLNQNVIYRNKKVLMLK